MSAIVYILNTIFVLKYEKKLHVNNDYLNIILETLDDVITAICFEIQSTS